MSLKLVISFPHMGDYSVVFTQLLRHLFPQADIIPAPTITQKTVELGSRHSPDFVCSPFKYNMGNYIEALEQGANVLFQTGVGCRYGYYGELQEQILRDMGYSFKFVCLSRERAHMLKAYQIVKQLGSPLSPLQMIHAVLLAAGSFYLMDRYLFFMRENIAFEKIEGSFEKVKTKLLHRIKKIHTLNDLRKTYAYCRQAMKKLPVCKPKHMLRVGVIGELFTIMEPFANFQMEKFLAEQGVSVTRQMSVWFLLFGKKETHIFKKTNGFLRYMVGANGADSVMQSLDYAKKGYDGIIHIKSFGCVPELNAVPALMNLSSEYGIPILHLSFDSHTSETGIQTRLEAFTDMIHMKKEKIYGRRSRTRHRHRVCVYQGSYVRQRRPNNSK